MVNADKMLIGVPDKPLLTAAEAGRILRVETSALKGFDIPVLLTGRRIRYRSKDLCDYINANFYGATTYRVLTRWQRATSL